MFIIDLNQVMISNMMVSIGKHDTDVNENLLRHMILNSVRLIRKKFKDEYGELIIACDDTNYWRKKYYPYYKANRKKSRQQSHLDWNSIFESLNKIRDELKEYFPYRVIQVETAEADDIIASLIREHGAQLGGDPILIVSGDKDFMQLQRYSNVKQYDPTRKRWLTTNDPIGFLYEHIMRGDTGDGIPNFLSADDVFVANGRQTPITQKKMDVWMEGLLGEKDFSEFMTETQIRNFSRNQRLIDLGQVPPDIIAEVMKQYNEQANKGRAKLFNYFIKNKLKNLMEDLSEF